MRALGWMLAGGCAGPVEPAEDVPTPTPPVPLPADTGPDWLRTGDVGDVTLIHSGPRAGRARRIVVAGVFADDLQGLPHAAACDRFGVLCVPSGLTREWTDTSDVTLAPDTSRFAWVGDTLGVGPRDVPFAVLPERPTGGYAVTFDATAVIGAALQGDLGEPLDLVVAGGEWGDRRLERSLPIPSPFGSPVPDPRDPVALGDRTLQVFEWEPTGEGALILTLAQGDWSAARALEGDPGQVAVSFADVRFSEPVHVELWRVGEPVTQDVNGNALTTTSVANQGWCVYDTCRPPFDSSPGGFQSAVPLDFTFCWTTTSCGQSRWWLAPDGTWQTTDGYIGTWSWACCSDTLTVVFSSGTTYRGHLGEDGCFDGEMVSWSGNTGVWQSCL